MSLLRVLLGDQALYVMPDAQSLKDAEAREARELRAQSGIVRHAQVDRSAFWQRVDARRARRRMAVVGNGVVRR